MVLYVNVPEKLYLVVLATLATDANGVVSVVRVEVMLVDRVVLDLLVLDFLVLVLVPLFVAGSVTSSVVGTVRVVLCTDAIVVIVLAVAVGASVVAVVIVPVVDCSTAAAHMAKAETAHREIARIVGLCTAGELAYRVYVVSSGVIFASGLPFYTAALFRLQ